MLVCIFANFIALMYELHSIIIPYYFKNLKTVHSHITIIDTHTDTCKELQELCICTPRLVERCIQFRAVSRSILERPGLAVGPVGHGPPSRGAPPSASGGRDVRIDVLAYYRGRNMF